MLLGGEKMIENHSKNLSKFAKDINLLDKDIVEIAKREQKRGIVDRTKGRRLVTMAEVTFFLNLSANTIKSYYRWSEDSVNDIYDNPSLPNYYLYISNPKSTKFWLKEDIYMILEFQKWVKAQRKKHINLNLMYYRQIKIKGE